MVDDRVVFQRLRRPMGGPERTIPGVAEPRPLRRQQLRFERVPQGLGRRMLLLVVLLPPANEVGLLIRVRHALLIRFVEEQGWTWWVGAAGTLVPLLPETATAVAEGHAASLLLDPVWGHGVLPVVAHLLPEARREDVVGLTPAQPSRRSDGNETREKGRGEGGDGTDGTGW